MMAQKIKFSKQIEMDVSTLPSGIYFLHADNERQLAVKKFVKELIGNATDGNEKSRYIMHTVAPNATVSSARAQNRGAKTRRRLKA
jgi:hypothetical protein